MIFSCQNYNAAFASPWTLNEGEYQISSCYSSIIHFSRHTKAEFARYKFRAQEIDELLAQKSEILDRDRSPNIPEDVRLSRAQILDKKIESLKFNLGKMRTTFQKSQSFSSFEKGLTGSMSAGVSFSIDRSLHTLPEIQEYSSMEFFARKQLYKSKKWAIAGKVGVLINNKNDHIQNILGISIGRVNFFKKRIKLINTVNLTYLTDDKTNLLFTFSKALEFIDHNIILSMDYTAAYNKNLDYQYRYYYKDQLTIAKKLGKHKILPANSVSISLGLYQEHFSKYKKITGRGIFFGISAKI
ncbi:MAG: hypothetical protein SFT91_01450 [Rickettsiaceae bacterium]|nr:hypothetical protein [Rickettsiaceae bacterium]